MFSGVVISFGRPERSASSVSLRPRLNSTKQIIHNTLMLSLNGILSHQKTVFYEHTKFHSFENKKSSVQSFSDATFVVTQLSYVTIETFSLSYF